MNFKRNIWDKTDVSTFEHTIFFKYSAAYNVVWYAFTVAVLYSVPHIARVSYLCKCMDLGCSVWENVQTLVCKGLCDTHSTGGLISSGLVSKKRRTSSLCEIWGGSRTSAWQTDRQTRHETRRSDPKQQNSHPETQPTNEYPLYWMLFHLKYPQGSMINMDGQGGKRKNLFNSARENYFLHKLQNEFNGSGTP